MPGFNLGNPPVSIFKKKKTLASHLSSSNQSIINQFHSSGGAVLLQVLLLTGSSTVVDDSREQQRWRCFASRTHAPTQTHAHTVRTSSSHQLRATPGAAQKQELFYSLFSSLRAEGGVKLPPARSALVQAEAQKQIFNSSDFVILILYSSPLLMSERQPCAAAK